jgi:hypothetical protein
MEHLTAFMKRFRRRRNVRTWLGLRPEVRDRAVARAIASSVGLPSSEEAWFDNYDLVPIDRVKAAEVLAFVATTSLAYGSNGPPRESYRKIAAEALGDLEPDAIFLTNTADWAAGGAVGFRAPHLSKATFEAGLIGYDARNAFIYWAEEED